MMDFFLQVALFTFVLVINVLLSLAIWKSLKTAAAKTGGE
jgi:hypothetical protein